MQWLTFYAAAFVRKGNHPTKPLMVVQKSSLYKMCKSQLNDLHDSEKFGKFNDIIQINQSMVFTVNIVDKLA